MRLSKGIDHPFKPHLASSSPYHSCVAGQRSGLWQLTAMRAQVNPKR